MLCPHLISVLESMATWLKTQSLESKFSGLNPGSATRYMILSKYIAPQALVSLSARIKMSHKVFKNFKWTNLMLLDVVLEQHLTQ